MPQKRTLNPDPKVRKKLKTIGFICLFIGAPTLVVSFVDFFVSASMMTMPRLFFLAFIGLPLVGVGIGCLQHGYIGSYTRYVAGEVSPVAVDTANYLYEGTKDNLHDLAATFGNSMQGKVIEVTCHKCRHVVKSTDQYCDQCGAVLKRICPSCQASNDGDARYCRQCGKEM